MSFLVFIAFEVFLGGGLGSLDRVKLSEGVPAPLLLSEWVGEFRTRRRDPSPWSCCPSGWMMTLTTQNSSSAGGDDVIHSVELSAQVRLVFGLGFHELAKHQQKRV